MTGPRPVLVGVLALQGDVREHTRALLAAGATVRPVRAATDLDGLDGIVVPGGESTTIGRLLERFDLLAPLRERLAAGLPAYGSCAGMVLLAEEVVGGLPGQPLLGGLDVTVRRNAFGGQVHSFQAPVALAGVDGRLDGVFIRAPWVERVGAGVEVLAALDGHPVAVRQGRLLATSFHPELTGDVRVHALFVELVRTTLRDAGPQRQAGQDGRSTVSGHSKWATTKHKKAVVDAKRGKLFAKLVKTIEVAARTGGGDLAGNPTLADAVAKAKGQSVPNENIDRAVKRGSGELGDAAAYEEITYEAYAPGGVAVLVECLTDNRNRAAADVRTAITRNGGNPADPGSVSYLFGRKGIVLVTKTPDLSEDDVLLAVLDAGAEDVNDLDEAFEVVCDASDTHAVRLAAADAGMTVESADIAWLPSVSVPLEDEVARKVLRLVDALEDLDDVQNVWANFDISDEVLESV